MTNTTIPARYHRSTEASYMLLCIIPIVPALWEERGPYLWEV